MEGIYYLFPYGARQKERDGISSPLVDGVRVRVRVMDVALEGTGSGCAVLSSQACGEFEAGFLSCLVALGVKPGAEDVCIGATEGMNMR